MKEVLNKSLCVFVSSSPALYLCVCASFVGKPKFGDLKKFFYFCNCFFSAYFLLTLWPLSFDWGAGGMLRTYLIWRRCMREGECKPRPNCSCSRLSRPDRSWRCEYTAYLDAQIQQWLQRWLIKKPNNSAGKISTLCFLHNSWVVWAFCGKGEVVPIPRLYCT